MEAPQPHRNMGVVAGMTRSSSLEELGFGT